MNPYLLTFIIGLSIVALGFITCAVNMVKTINTNDPFNKVKTGMTTHLIGMGIMLIGGATVAIDVVAYILHKLG